MGIGTLGYTKDWTSPSDFPSVEPDEAQARQDMQFLFDEVKNYINNVLLPGLKGMEVIDFKVDSEGRFVFTDANNVTHAYDVGPDFVSNVSVNGSGELVIEFVNGEETNLGKVGSGGDPIVKVDVTSTGYIQSTFASGKTQNSASRVIPRSLMNAANGVAGLDASGKLSADVMPAGAGVASGTLSVVADSTAITGSGEWYRVGNLVFLAFSFSVGSCDEAYFEFEFSGFPTDVTWPDGWIVTSDHTMVGETRNHYSSPDRYRALLGKSDHTGTVGIGTVNAVCIVYIPG